MNALSGNLAETPNQRPFPWIQVQLDMPKHRVGHSPLGGDLLFFVNRDQAGDGFGLLAPSIEKITVEESEQDVLVSGFFGTAADPSGRSQELRMGGSTLHVTEWFPGLVRATLPKDVAGLTNLTLGAHKSNDAMVTAWDQLTLDYKFFWSTLMEQTLFKVNLRADIRAYREQIHEHSDPTYARPRAGARLNGQVPCRRHGDLYRRRRHRRHLRSHHIRLSPRSRRLQSPAHHHESGRKLSKQLIRTSRDCREPIGQGKLSDPRTLRLSHQAPLTSSTSPLPKATGPSTTKCPTQFRYFSMPAPKSRPDCTAPLPSKEATSAPARQPLRNLFNGDPRHPRAGTAPRSDSAR